MPDPSQNKQTMEERATELQEVFFERYPDVEHQWLIEGMDALGAEMKTVIQAPPDTFDSEEIESEISSEVRQKGFFVTKISPHEMPE